MADGNGGVVGAHGARERAQQRDGDQAGAGHDEDGVEAEGPQARVAVADLQRPDEPEGEVEDDRPDPPAVGHRLQHPPRRSPDAARRMQAPGDVAAAAHDQEGEEHMLEQHQRPGQRQRGVDRQAQRLHDRDRRKSPGADQQHQPQPERHPCRRPVADQDQAQGAVIGREEGVEGGDQDPRHDEAAQRGLDHQPAFRIADEARRLQQPGGRREADHREELEQHVGEREGQAPQGGEQPAEAAPVLAGAGYLVTRIGRRAGIEEAGIGGGGLLGRLDPAGQARQARERPRDRPVDGEHGQQGGGEHDAEPPQGAEDLGPPGRVAEDRAEPGAEVAEVAQGMADVTHLAAERRAEAAGAGQDFGAEAVGGRAPRPWRPSPRATPAGARPWPGWSAW